MQKKIILFQDQIAEVGGVETHLYNFCVNLYEYYDILVLYGHHTGKQIQRLMPYVKVEKYDENKQYTCDICIRNSLYWKIPENIKADKYYEMLHADYEWLSDKTKINQWDKAEKIGCGEFVAKQYEKVYGTKVKWIRNILAPTKQVEKVYHFISCTRLGPEKGWNRMKKMMEMMRSANIKFTWDIITNTRLAEYEKPEEVRLWNNRFDVFDYVADADYVVQLSDAEGLPYTIQEALQYETPCIVSDIGGMTELIQDGVNGYVVPLDMNFDINKIKKIPKCSHYDNKAFEKWCELLGGAEYVRKERKYTMVRVKALVDYNDVQLGRKVLAGEIIEVEQDRADYLVGGTGYKIPLVEVLEVIEKPVEKVVKKPVEKKEDKKETEKVKKTIKKAKK